MHRHLHNLLYVDQSATNRDATIDRGVSFIELLVSIVLLGTVVIGVLAAARTTVIGTRIEQDHSNAHQWLQSASEIVRAIETSGCNTSSANPPGPSTAATDYQTAAATLAPQDWDGTVTVTAPVKWWNDVTQIYEGRPLEVNCDDGNVQVQLIELTVRNSDGSIVESVEVVKRV